MKYRKKPIVVDLLEYGIGLPAVPEWVEIRTQPDGTTAVWNGRHRSWIGLKPGDFLNVTDANDVYPIDATAVHDTYEPAD